MLPERLVGEGSLPEISAADDAWLNHRLVSSCVCEEAPLTRLSFPQTGNDD